MPVAQGGRAGKPARAWPNATEWREVQDSAYKRRTPHFPLPTGRMSPSPGSQSRIEKAHGKTPWQIKQQ